jgi:hypothetical protein
MDGQRRDFSPFRFAYIVKEHLSICLFGPECLMKSRFPLCPYSESEYERCYSWEIACSLCESAPGLWEITESVFDMIGPQEIPMVDIERLGMEAAVREERRKYVNFLFFAFAAIWAENGFSFPKVFLTRRQSEQVIESLERTSLEDILAAAKKEEEKENDFFILLVLLLKEEFKSASLLPIGQKAVFLSAFCLAERIRQDREKNLLAGEKRISFDRKRIISDVEKFLKDH